jgi:hypothetical protein
MRMHAACARRRLGQLVGGDEGNRLVEEADAWMREQKVVQPSRIAALYAPFALPT